MKKIFDALVDGSVALISRFLPDAYILVLLLTVILFVVAVPVTGIAPAEGITVADRLCTMAGMAVSGIFLALGCRWF